MEYTSGLVAPSNSFPSAKLQFFYKTYTLTKPGHKDIFLFGCIYSLFRHELQLGPEMLYITLKVCDSSQALKSPKGTDRVSFSTGHSRIKEIPKYII